MYLIFIIIYSKLINKCFIFCSFVSVSSNKVENLEENLNSRFYFMFYLMIERFDCYR